MSKGLLFETVNEKIGEDYKRWGDRDCIFINAPTGSGKTTFVLERLLPYFAGKGKTILYLVNRRILKKQIEKSVSKLPQEYHASIEIALYQEIEKGLCSIQNKKMYKGDAAYGKHSHQIENFASCNCVICDEAHYFLADSNYNTNTSISFFWIQAKFKEKLSIYMSATCNEILYYIQKNNLYKLKAGYSAYYNICKPNEKDAYDKSINQIREQQGKETQMEYELEKRPIVTYSIERNYDYIASDDIRIIHNREDIVEGRDKWLIFIDDIKQGKKLQTAIGRKCRTLKKGSSSKNTDIKIIMLTSGYKRDKDGDRQVERIIKKEVSSARVLITTSVLDNGINIKDIELRNVVLFADTETEFIQMLGRKRRDEQPLKLYIYRYGKKHFLNRERQLEKKRR